MVKNKVNPVVAGVVGAVVGAAVGAGAVVLSNEKNRKAIKNKFKDLKEQGQKVYSDLQGKVEKLSATAEESVSKKTKDIKKSIKAKL